MVESNPKLVLASASPRRLALLDRIGLAPDLLNPADVDETPLKRESPRRLTIRLATAKVEKAKSMPLVKEMGNAAYVLAADTVVGLGRRVLPKAETYQDAKDCLTLLSGRSHWVYTTVALLAPDGKITSRCVETKIRFKRFSRDDIESYLKSEEWRGKAGGYAIQGRAEAFVRYMAGSHSAVIGLPLYETVLLLQGAGFPVSQKWMSQPISDL
ncbi:MAG: septum formation protein Maf [Alphaproteobacteria bacterium]|nr:septum formation protein Maf [Alphaproteobacteria bacterium]